MTRYIAKMRVAVTRDIDCTDDEAIGPIEIFGDQRAPHRLADTPPLGIDEIRDHSTPGQRDRTQRTEIVV
jgi:hypothetical protein